MKKNLNAAIDFGNTSLKVGLFQDDLLISVHKNLSIGALSEFFATHNPSKVIVGDVTGKAGHHLRALTKKHSLLYLDYKLKLPFSNRYKTPETLGADRIAAIAGAIFLHSGNDCLIIDIGTCITYDFVTAAAEYLGGGISPGWKLRFRAMNEFTAKLPLVHNLNLEISIGNSTEQSMQVGVSTGIAGEIEKWIAILSQSHPNLKVLFCGGDAIAFKTIINKPILVYPDLVLTGLNSILKENVSQ